MRENKKKRKKVRKKVWREKRKCLLISFCLFSGFSLISSCDGRRRERERGRAEREERDIFFLKISEKEKRGPLQKKKKNVFPPLFLHHHYPRPFYIIIIPAAQRRRANDPTERLFIIENKLSLSLNLNNGKKRKKRMYI